MVAADHACPPAPDPRPGPPGGGGTAPRTVARGSAAG
jgi:hypothetical protein